MVSRLVASPTEAIVVSAAMPIVTPSIIRKLRSGLRDKVRRASEIVRYNCIASPARDSAVRGGAFCRAAVRYNGPHRGLPVRVVAYAAIA